MRKFIFALLLGVLVGLPSVACEKMPKPPTGPDPVIPGPVLGILIATIPPFRDMLPINSIGTAIPAQGKAGKLNIRLSGLSAGARVRLELQVSRTDRSLLAPAAAVTANGDGTASAQIDYSGTAAQLVLYSETESAIAGNGGEVLFAEAR